MEAQTYNRFAERLVDHLVARATGRDEASARLVGMRPADHILAGFLTPARQVDRGRPWPIPELNGRAEAVPDDDAEAPDEGSASDLPQDSAYEMSALGFEWLLPVPLAAALPPLTITLAAAVYVRTLPSFAELAREVRWRTPAPARRTQGRPASADGHVAPRRQTEIVPVWTRIQLPPLTATVALADLVRTGQVEQPLEAQVRAALVPWVAEQAGELYPARRRLLLDESECSEDGYAGWRRETPPSTAVLSNLVWSPVIDLRTTPVATQPNCVRVSLRVINKTAPVELGAQDCADPNLYAVALRADLPRAVHRMMEFAELPRSYRYDREIAAVGINADVRLERPADPAPGSRLALITESMPRRQVDRLEPREIADAVPTFAALRADPILVLERILTAMRRYDAEAWAAKVADLPTSSRQEAERDRALFQSQEIAAFARGIALLADARYPWVGQAFLWMNETMERLAQGKYDRWRLFQIVFIVLQLPRLAARQFPELAQPGDDAVDILWFAAGGGKTEAFLGLLVWQIFFDRLRGKTFGTTAMVRFPLRLLTFQQLQRMARVLAQAELIREREKLAGPRISLGYFVGDTTRPNSIDTNRHARYQSLLPVNELRSLMRCPFCNSEVMLVYRKDLRLVEHYCTNAASCPGGKARLPLYIVDADIYQYLPTVIVSTVDKLAVLGQNQRFTNLFGRFDLVCGTHGASFRGSGDSYRKCEAAQAYAANPADPSKWLDACGGKRVTYGPFHDPGPALLIQDELHLLSEEMGTFDAHYETAALETMRSLGAQPWKIVAATATIERFEQHARHLYLLPARQFPCPGPAAYDSFYYALDRERIGRIFVGVLGVARKHTPAVTRLTSLLYQELQTARDLAAADIATACARYDLPPLTAQDFAALIFRYELVLTYVLTRKGSDQVAEAVRSRVQRELDQVMPTHGNLLLQLFNSDVDTPTLLGAMENIELAPVEAAPTERIRGVIATNIISHGVDIDRFNIMVFGGFTRLVAEYIQASARVGRTYPGISLLVVTPQSERDRSIFQRFGKFHEYLDRMVDPSAINRWPAQALERTVSGVLAGYLMGVAAARVGRLIYSVQDFQRLLGAPGAEALAEEVVLDWVTRALGVDQAPYTEYRRAVELVVRKRYAQLANSPLRQGETDRISGFLDAMRNLRDIDDPGYIGIIRSAQAMLRNLQRA